jgi:hypothetical protein
MVGAALPVRIALAIVLIAPLGFAMGMPFPAGLEAIQEDGQQAVAWAWAANGSASVAGSALAMLGAISFGYSSVLMLGAGCYALAALVRPKAGQASA